ncbi:Fic family protein [Thiotrichales bacterium 19S9-12]|nr:Fic family protein [Thiotrichales bacterium 19S9-11]MCF6810927.1 Fic family protein [Thiotrichales bacterium 19S9-12]
MDFSKFDQMKQRLDSYRPLSKELVDNLYDNLILNWTYHSNAIEGNTLTLKETKVALEGITVGGKTLREHFEAINHKDAILYLEEIIKDKEPLCEWTIKSIHQLILKSIDDANAGKYRTINVRIMGANHIPPEHYQLNELMAQLIKDYESWQDLHPIEQAARMHGEFVKIHPFVDGNGRTSRLLMNLILMQNGYPAAILPVEKRLEYYNALDIAHTQNNYEPFIELISQIVEDAFKTYWFALGVKD